MEQGHTEEISSALFDHLNKSNGMKRSQAKFSATVHA